MSSPRCLQFYYEFHLGKDKFGIVTIIGSTSCCIKASSSIGGFSHLKAFDLSYLAIHVKFCVLTFFAHAV